MGGAKRNPSHALLYIIGKGGTSTASGKAPHFRGRELAKWPPPASRIAPLQEPEPE